MQTCMHMPGYPYYSHLLDFCFPKNFKPTTEERGTINSWLLALDQLRSYQTCSVENLFEYKTPVGTPLDTTNYNIYPPHYLKLFFSDEEFQNYVAIMPLFMPMMFYGPKGSDNLRTVFATPIAYQHTFRTDLLFYLQTQAFYSFVEQSGSETTALKKWENSDTLDAPIDIFCEPDMRNARHMLLLPELNQNNGFVKYMVLPTNENRPIIKQRFKNAVKASIGMKKNKSSNKNRAI